MEDRNANRPEMQRRLDRAGRLNRAALEGRRVCGCPEEWEPGRYGHSIQCDHQRGCMDRRW